MPTWSCRLSPTRRSWSTGKPSRRRCSAGPTPDSISSCGLPMLPADNTTSRLACTACSRPPRTNCTLVARFVAGSMITLVTCACMATCRLARSRAGRRNALAVLHRVPRLMVPCRQPNRVSCTGPGMHTRTGVKCRTNVHGHSGPRAALHIIAFPPSNLRNTECGQYNYSIHLTILNVLQ